MASAHDAEKMKGGLEDGGDNLYPNAESALGEEEEDEVIEIDLEKTVEEVVLQWTGLARFNSVRRFSVKLRTLR